MQNKSMYELSDYVIDKMNNFFGDKFKNYCVKDLYDSDYSRCFSIELIAYQYLPLVFRYDRGRIGCCLNFGSMDISLNNSQKWMENVDLNTFFVELKRELELRIPDKFLEENGWLSSESKRKLF